MKFFLSLYGKTKFKSYQALLPAVWLQNFFNASKVNKNKCHML